MKGKLDRIVVYGYLCGDLLHKGHLVHLRNARALGDFLIIGVLTDAAIKERKPQPVISFDERFELVRSLEFVDIAIPQDTYSPIKNINMLKPDIVAESSSHTPELIKAVTKAMNSIGGKVIVLPYYPDHSSTQIKQRIQDGKES